MKQFFFDRPIGRIVLVVIFLILLGLLGHFVFPSPTPPPATVSTLTEAEAKHLAVLIVNTVPGSRLTKVAGTGSMRPTFDWNCYVVVRTVPIDAIRPGMILIAPHPEGEGRTIIHRVLRRDSDGWVLKGDGNKNEDGFRVADGMPTEEALAVIFFNDKIQ